MDKMSYLKDREYYKLLEGILFNMAYSVFVTDGEGKVIMANPAASHHLNIPLEVLIGSNVKELVDTGQYDRSTAWEAIINRNHVMGVVKSINGLANIADSTPLFDEKGNISMVITNSRDKELFEEVISKLNKQMEINHLYKSEIEYLRERQKDTELVVAASPEMKKILNEVDKIASTDSTIMIYGESGTGKEVIAQYIHRQSERAERAFISVNCAAIPESLLESEFFGYEKGAFTGASSKGKPGMFELSNHGTIFLDEIAEMPVALQSKLLRVLETREVRRIGGTKLIKLDLRIIGATNKDLANLVSKNCFREDLYYRLNVIPIYIPPLRYRPDDIRELAQMFLKENNLKYGYHRFFGSGTIKTLCDYKWPGNVRELRNVVERAVITSNQEEITISWVFHQENSKEDNVSSNNDHDNYDAQRSLVIPETGNLKEIIQEVESIYINKVLDDCNGCIAQAAKQLGIHRSVIYRKLKHSQDRKKIN